ncbi:MAG: LEA type 2 family protein [Sphingobacteriia bacterium]
MKTPLVLVFCCLILMACSKPKEFEYRDVRKVKLNSLGFNQSTLSFEIVYYNPNQFGLDLRKVDSDVFIDSLFLGKFQLDTIMHIERMSEFALPATIQLDMKNLLKHSASMLFHKEVLIEARGTVKVGKGGLFKTVPFNYQSKQALNLF